MTIKISVCNLDNHRVVSVFYRRPVGYTAEAVQQTLVDKVRPLEAKEFYVHETQEIHIAEDKP